MGTGGEGWGLQVRGPFEGQVVPPFPLFGKTLMYVTTCHQLSGWDLPASCPAFPGRGQWDSMPLPQAPGLRIPPGPGPGRWERGGPAAAAGDCEMGVVAEPVSWPPGEGVEESNAT